MHKLTKQLTSILAVLLLVFTLGHFTNDTQTAKAGVGHNLAGYAWSDNIGWLSFNSTNNGGAVDYGVAVDETNRATNGTGDFSGYAWSDNIGWITFNEADLAGCPEAPCKAEIDWATGQVTGWARALGGDYVAPPSGVALTVDTPTANYDICTEAIASAGDVTGLDITLTNNSTIYSTNTANAALTTGTCPANSITLVNNGEIIGAGGDGGGGGDYNWPVVNLAGKPGEDGGDAIDVQLDLIIDDNTGQIYGGGGGGGGGAAADSIFALSPGSGGGGGAGYNNSGAGGSVGINYSSSPLYSSYFAAVCPCSPTPGIAGSDNGGGGGVKIFVSQANFQTPPSLDWYTGIGGTGGGYETDGNSGGGGLGLFSGSFPGGIGGVGGQKINNPGGYLVNWI